MFWPTSVARVDACNGLIPAFLFPNKPLNININKYIDLGMDMDVVKELVLGINS